MATVVGLTALATAALVLVARGIWGLRRLALISSWPVVHGTVVAPALEEFPPSEGGPTHRPKLTYSYVLNGRTYRSSRLGITSSAFDFFSPESARAFLARFPSGSRVDISVSPDAAHTQSLCNTCRFWRYPRMLHRCCGVCRLTTGSRGDAPQAARA